MLEETPPRRLPPFGRRSSKPGSASSSLSSTPRQHAQPVDDTAAYPSKTDSARGSLSAAAGKNGGKFESILSFIAASEEEASGAVEEDTAMRTTLAATTRSALPATGPQRLAAAPTRSASADVSQASSPSHQRSMFATTGHTYFSPPVHPLSSTASHIRSPSLSFPSASSTDTSTSSPFEAYRAKMHSLAQTVTSLESTIAASQASHVDALAVQHHAHQQATAALTKQCETRLQEQLAFIEQLVASNAQLAAELEQQSQHVRQREEQLLSRHVELELDSENKVKQRLEASKAEWRDKEMRLVKANVRTAIEREVEKMRARQGEEVKLLDDKWREKFHATREEAERQAKAREAELRRQWVDEGMREKEGEERRRDELVRQLTLDFATKQAELSRQHEAERRGDKQRWEEEKQAEDDRRRKAEADRDERLTREWQQRLSAEQQAHEADKQRHEAECDLRLQRATQQAEEQLQERVRREGEAELAHVIERLGEETVALSKDERAKHRQALDRLQRERADDRQAWHEKEKRWKEQAERAAEQLRAHKQQQVAQSAEWQARWSEAEEWRQQLEQLGRERQQTAAVQQHLRQEDNEALAALQQQLKRGGERWKRERQQLLDEQQEERAAWQARWEEKSGKEMREVERRVKETVRKKDEVVDGLQKEMRRLQGQIVAMTDTIEQQRHELRSLG